MAMFRDLNDILILRNDDDIIFDLIVSDILNNGIPRQLYQRADHFNKMPDLLFFQHFRLKKETVLSLLAEIENKLEYIHNLNNSVSPINQLLICLRFYATGCHQLSLTYFGGMHKSTVNRIVKKVTHAICSLAKKYIKLPVNAEEITNSKEAFYEIARFPNVVGVIDGTHIKITSPGGNDAEVFRNRKSYFSINVQAVADAHYKIIDIVARWPGSAHDMTIFNNSVLKAKFENNEFPNCFLLGDGGYALKSYLLTPLLETRNESQNNYNNAHKKTRVLIENAFGILKRRFPVLAYGCRTHVDLTLNIIVASTILHNIAREANTVEPPLEVENEELFQYYLRLGNIHLQAQDGNFINNGNNDNAPDNGNGFYIRNELIQNYFQHLN